MGFLTVCHSRRTTPEKFYIEPRDDGSEEVLAIDRVSTEMTLTGKHISGDWSPAHTEDLTQEHI